MCTSCEAAEPTNSHANGTTNGTSTNGTNGTTNGNHEGFTAIPVKPAPRPTAKAGPYAAVGDFLSNVGNFKIIGTSFRTKLSILKHLVQGVVNTRKDREDRQAAGSGSRIAATATERVRRGAQRASYCRCYDADRKGYGLRSSQKALYGKASSLPTPISTWKPRSRSHAPSTSLVLTVCLPRGTSAAKCLD